MPSFLRLWHVNCSLMDEGWDLWLGRSAMCSKILSAVAAAVLAIWAGASSAAIAPITAGDMLVQPLETGQVKSAVGGLDLIIATGQEGVGVLNNEFGGLNIDDSNSDLPTGGIGSAEESYITTIGEIRAFLDQMFGPSAVNNLVIFTDMQQSQQDSIQIDLFEIVVNPTNVPDPSGDVTTDEQNAIEGTFTNGTVVSSTTPDVVAPVTLQAGSGWADWAIITNFNPYDPAFSNSDTILFHFVGQEFTAASETLFISGSATIIDTPEPATLAAFGVGIIGLALLQRRRKK
jgi:hypothetical protein